MKEISEIRLKMTELEERLDQGKISEQVFLTRYRNLEKQLQELLEEPISSTDIACILSQRQRYKIQKTLGHGGMGKVFLACDSNNNNQEVAIKQVCIPPETPNFDNITERFKREHYFLSQIDHPNIPKAYDFFEEDEQIFMVLEYVRGVSLDRFIGKKQNKLSLMDKLSLTFNISRANKEHKLSLLDKLAIALSITRAVEIINTVGIIHRDIKPENIMIEEQTHTIKLVDFGIARLLHDHMQRLTGTGGIIGTPAYMSPEQINGEIKPNSDVFSLAIVLYQLFSESKKSPFLASTVIKTVMNINNMQLPLLKKKMLTNNPTEKQSVEQISQIIANGLVKDHTKRTSGADELGDQLQEVYDLLLNSIKETDSDYQVTWEPGAKIDRAQKQKLTKLGKEFKTDLGLISSENLATTTKWKKYALISVLFLAIIFTIFKNMSKYEPKQIKNNNKKVAKQNSTISNQKLKRVEKANASASTKQNFLAKKTLAQLRQQIQAKQYQQAWKITAAKLKKLKTTKFYQQKSSFIDQEIAKLKRLYLTKYAVLLFLRQPMQSFDFDSLQFSTKYDFVDKIQLKDFIGTVHQAVISNGKLVANPARKEVFEMYWRAKIAGKIQIRAHIATNQKPTNFGLCVYKKSFELKKIEKYMFLLKFNLRKLVAKEIAHKEPKYLRFLKLDTFPVVTKNQAIIAYMQNTPSRLRYRNKAQKLLLARTIIPVKQQGKLVIDLKAKGKRLICRAQNIYLKSNKISYNQGFIGLYAGFSITCQQLLIKGKLDKSWVQKIQKFVVKNSKIYLNRQLVLPKRK